MKIQKMKGSISVVSFAALMAITLPSLHAATAIPTATATPTPTATATPIVPASAPVTAPTAQPTTPTPAPTPTSATTQTPAPASPDTASLPSDVSIKTDPDGEKYNTDVLNSTKKFSRHTGLSAFTAASLIVPTSVDKTAAASVCVQKVANEQTSGMFRSHSANPDARGLVTNQGDLTAFGPLFQLNPGSKFILRVTKDLNGDVSQGMINFVGLVFFKDGNGTADGDTVCFSRYLQPVS